MVILCASGAKTRVCGGRIVIIITLLISIFLSSHLQSFPHTFPPHFSSFSSFFTLNGIPIKLMASNNPKGPLVIDSSRLRLYTCGEKNVFVAALPLYIHG